MRLLAVAILVLAVAIVLVAFEHMATIPIVQGVSTLAAPQPAPDAQTFVTKTQDRVPQEAAAAVAPPPPKVIYRTRTITKTVMVHAKRKKKKSEPSKTGSVCVSHDGGLFGKDSVCGKYVGVPAADPPLTKR